MVQQDAIVDRPVNRPVQVLFASMIGTTIEFFDFYIYATAAVLVFPQLFFPASRPETAVLASFATFVRANTLSPVGPATFIKIPWTPKLADPLSVAVLTMSSRGLVTPKPATWFEEAFWGRCWVVNAGFGDIGSPVNPLAIK